MKPHSNKLSPSKFHRKASNLNQSMANTHIDDDLNTAKLVLHLDITGCLLAQHFKPRSHPSLPE